MSAAATWFLYCTGVALFFALAARAADAAAREVGWAGRWAWLCAMAGSLLVPAVSWLGLRAWEVSVPALPDAMALALPVLTLDAVEAGSAAGAVDIAVFVWIAMSLLLSALLVAGMARLHAARRGWRVAEVDGTRVLLTEEIGPAVFGLRRISILLPAWALTMREDLRALMLLHEREHVRARDPWLIAFALALVVLMPWNPILWLQLHRLRLAVEMDCDARVLRRSGDARTYGALLLEVGRRRGAPLPVLTLSEPATFLEQRIRLFTRGLHPHARRRAAALAGLSLSLLVLAVCARDPVSPQPLPAQEELAVSTSGSPEFTPYTMKPELKNPAQVAAALQRAYPPLLRDAGIGGKATFWFFIDANGVVQKIQLWQSSGHAALDAAAHNVAAQMEFRPALNGEAPVSVWVAIPVTFASVSAAESGEASAPRSTERVPLAVLQQKNLPVTPQNGPQFTPYTERPSLINAAEVQQALKDHYPPLLRDAGIGGRALIWFLIDETGVVQDARINEAAGHTQLDEAALRVARMMRFRPARNDGEPVPVWVAIPITFSAK